jgi:hypothetical protein
MPLLDSWILKIQPVKMINLLLQNNRDYFKAILKKPLKAWIINKLFNFI